MDGFRLSFFLIIFRKPIEIPRKWCLVHTSLLFANSKLLIFSSERFNSRLLYSRAYWFYISCSGHNSTNSNINLHQKFIIAMIAKLCSTVSPLLVAGILPRSPLINSTATNQMQIEQETSSFSECDYGSAAHLDNMWAAVRHYERVRAEEIARAYVQTIFRHKWFSV